MKKLGVITFFYDNFNYGAVLQAYALQKVLSKYVCDTEVILIDNIRKKEHLGLKNLLIFKKLNLRKKAIRSFQLDCVQHSHQVYNELNISNANNIYSDFVCGSDIIWCNPLIYNANIYWMDFVAKGKKKFSYAASIGREYTKQESLVAEKFLSDFDLISVREYQAVRQIHNNNMKVVLDPTFLLPKEHWNKIATTRLVKQDYIFAFLLDNDEKIRRNIVKYAKAHCLKIVTLPYMLFNFRKCDSFFGDIRLYDISPQEFLSLVKFSNKVFTDSYHGAIFSMIFHKQFSVFKRNENLDVRINELVKKFELNFAVINDISDIATIDYDLFEEKLYHHKIASINFIKSMKDMLI